MKTIGQFAKENNITVKTLHHYEKLELILPEKVDQDSGYRYYSDTAQRNLEIVLFFKELGFSLSEIKSTLNKENKDHVLDILNYKKVSSNDDIQRVEKRLILLTKTISALHSNNNIDWKEIMKMSKNQNESGNYGKGHVLEFRDDLINQAINENKPLTVCVMDVDYFAKVNDNFGREVGDIVLDRIYNELSAHMHELHYSNVLTKEGGDEYVITIQATPKDASLVVSEAMNRVVAIDYSDIAGDLKVSISAGFVGFSEKRNTYTKLHHEASIELYNSKVNQRKRN